MADLSGSTPAHDYIYVKDEEFKTPSGITLAPGVRRSGHTWGTVVAVGPGRYSEASGQENLHLTVLGMSDKKAEALMPWGVGDRLLYSTGAGIQDCKYDGEEVRIITPRDIVAVR